MRKIALLLTVAFLFLQAAPQVLAIEIRITATGQVLFYNDGVLGKKSDEADQDAKPVKNLKAEDGEKIKIETKEDKIQIEVEKSKGKDKDQSGSSGQPDFTQSEKIETERVRVLTPAAPSGVNIEVKESKPSFEQKRQEEYRKEVREERKARKDEMIELRSQIDQYQQTRLELFSRTTKARLSPGSQFEVNTESNQVMIATPSGTYVLEHLPDQAVARMERLGLKPTLDSAEVVIDTNARGELVYRTQANRRKRVFGIFGRDVKTTVELNDSTGEIIEKQVPASSLWGQFLDVVSF